jgi:DNA-binding transcriptional LysR family regulator
MGQFEDMEVFVAIVDADGIGKAAERLHVAKSAVSRRLVELEKRLGVQLINRTTRQSSLTEEGNVFYRRAQEILVDVSELNAITSRTQTVLQGDLKVAVPLSFGLQHVAAAIIEFAKLHSALDIHLDFSDRHVDIVDEGFDVAIRISELKDSTLIARKLATIRHVLCASPDYLDRNGRPTCPQDLKTHVGIHYSNAPNISWKFVGPDGRTNSVVVPARLTANNGDFLREAAVAGQGLILPPAFLVWKQIENGELEPVMTDYSFPDTNAYAVYPETRYLSQRVRALVDFLIDRFSSAPYWDKGL